jgi:hypothetical protein
MLQSLGFKNASALLGGYNLWVNKGNQVLQGR